MNKGEAAREDEDEAPYVVFAGEDLDFCRGPGGTDVEEGVRVSDKRRMGHFQIRSRGFSKEILQ